MMLDIRQRTGWLFTGVVLAQMVLISAQVTTRTGVPMLEVAVFGTVAEVQRLASGVMQGADDSWHNYVALQEVRRENASLKTRWPSCRSSCSRNARWRRRRARSSLLDLQAQTPSRDDCGLRHRRRRQPRFPHADHRQGNASGLAGATWP